MVVDDSEDNTLFQLFKNTKLAIGDKVSNSLPIFNIYTQLVAYNKCIHISY